MIFSWIAYFVLSFGISYLISKFSKRRFLKVLLFSFSLAALSTVWFKNPGENLIAPIISIFILESTILEGNGLIRIIRPMGFVSFFIILISLFLWKKNTKN